MKEVDRPSDGYWDGALDEYADRLVEGMMDQEIDPDEAKSLMTMHLLFRYAHKVPLVNAKTGEKEIVESDDSVSAAKKYHKRYVFSDGDWDVDSEAFVKMMSTPEERAHLEPMMPRINREATEALQRAIRRHPNDAWTWGSLFRAGWLLHKVIKVLRHLVRW